MNRGGFQKPTVTIPSPDKAEDEVDIDLFNLSTTTWSQLAESTIAEGTGFGDFEKLSPLHQASPRKMGADMNVNMQNMLPPPPAAHLTAGGAKDRAGRMESAEGGSVPGNRGQGVVLTSYSNSGITPSMSTMVQTPRHYFESSPTYAQLKDAQINYSSSNFWGSTRNSTSRVGGGSRGASEGGNFRNDGYDDDEEYIPEKPLSARGKQIFFEHISGVGSAAAAATASGGGGARGNTRKRTSSSKPGSSGVGGGRSTSGSTTKSNIIRKAKEAAKIAHSQYEGSPLLVTPERRCKCKKSKCLKLYCECFAAHVYCTPGACRCIECNNLGAFEGVRVAAIESALARNVNAFTNKVTKAEKRASMTKSAGCNCRKSLCLKKYCECFFTGMLCTSECKCVNCENYSGSVALANKREQMRKDQEVADLVKEVGAAAAQAVQKNGVDPAEAKRNAMRIKEEQNRRQQAVLAAQQQIDRRQQSMERKEPSSVDTAFTKKMGSLGVSPRSASAAAASQAEINKGSYKSKKPTDGLLFSEEDWEFAAEIAADILDMPDSTKSTSGKSPVYKKGRMFSPKQTEEDEGGGGGSGRGGGGSVFTF